MSDTYYYFECVNTDCGRDIAVDIRVKDGGKAVMATNCPVCGKGMDFRGQSAADADGCALRVQPSTLREMTKRVWMRVGKMHNPWTNAAMSSHDHGVAKTAAAWYQKQIELGRAMFAVVYGDVAPTEKLLLEGLTFSSGQP